MLYHCVESFSTKSSSRSCPFMRTLDHSSRADLSLSLSLFLFLLLVCLFWCQLQNLTFAFEAVALLARKGDAKAAFQSVEQ